MEATSGRTIRLLTAAQATNAVGDGCFLVTSALFLSQVVGLSAGQTGLWLSLAWGTGFVLSTPLGRLADRLGLQRCSVALSLLVAAALAATALARDHVVLLGVITCYAVAQSGLGALRQAIVADAAAPAERVRVRARLHVVVNSGLGLGAGIGGLALAAGTEAAYSALLWFDAACFVVAAALLGQMPALPRRASAAGPTIRRGGVLRDVPYLTAAALTAVLYLYMPMLTVALPLYLVQATAAPASTMSLVFLTNTLGVILLQVRAARPVLDTVAAARAVRRGSVALGAACLVLAAAGLPASPAAALAVVCLGAAVQVGGEVLVAAGAWHIGFALGDPDRPGEWQALFASGQPLARSIGPALLTALVLTWPGPGWLVLGAVFAAAGAALASLAARGDRPTSPTASVPPASGSPNSLGRGGKTVSSAVAAPTPGAPTVA